APPLGQSASSPSRSTVSTASGSRPSSARRPPWPPNTWTPTPTSTRPRHSVRRRTAAARTGRWSRRLRSWWPSTSLPSSAETRASSVGAKELKAAKAQLAATIANEVRLSGGRPVDDNPHVRAARRRVAGIERELERQLRWWEEEG